KTLLALSVLARERSRPTPDKTAVEQFDDAAGGEVVEAVKKGGRGKAPAPRGSPFCVFPRNAGCEDSARGPAPARPASRNQRHRRRQAGAIRRGDHRRRSEFRRES